MKGKCGVLVFETELFLIFSQVKFYFLDWTYLAQREEKKEREGGRYKVTETALLCVSADCIQIGKKQLGKVPCW